MEMIKRLITDWLKEMLVGGIISNLSGLFDSVNERVGDIANQVGQTPEAWNSSVFSMVQSLSENVIMPIAGIILAIVMAMELIQLIVDRNNLNEVDTWMYFKWMFKTVAAVIIVTNTWDIVMGIFDLAHSVVGNAASAITGDASLSLTAAEAMEDSLMELEIGELLSLWFQSIIVGITMWALSICIFVVVYGRMLEIYLVTSLAPVPMATMMNREWGSMGQNYLRSLFALAFQAFLIMVCVAIYAVLVQNIATDENISKAIWTCMGYTVLLCFSLFKTGSLAKGLFNAH